MAKLSLKETRELYPQIMYGLSLKELLDALNIEMYGVPDRRIYKGIQAEDTQAEDKVGVGQGLL